MSDISFLCKSRLGAALISMIALAPAVNAQKTCDIPNGTVPLEFKSEQNTLRGFIDVPEGTGGHPAIVIVHGSGSTDVTRGDGGYNSSYDELRAAFRAIGLATVIWDNAGNGCSDGAYTLGTPIVQRTNETVAALDVLKRREDIDPSRIGLWAISLGGWIAPMAAVRRPEVAFLIIVSGPGKHATAETEYNAYNQLRKQGVSEAEARSASETLRRALMIVAAGGSHQEFIAAIEPLEKYPVFDDLGITETPEMKSSAAGAEAYRKNQLGPDYVLRADTYLSELHQPTLAIFGDHDAQVNWRVSAPSYRESFKHSGNRELTIKIFKNADHNLYDVSKKAQDGKAAHGSRLVPGYVKLMIEWLEAHGFSRTVDAAKKERRRE